MMINSREPFVLIMAGGSGTRMWPMSREKRPKQLLSLYSEKSLMQETRDRALELTSEKNIIIGTGSSLKEPIAENLNFSDENFLIEPEAKNTAPIIALFAARLEKMGCNDNPVMVLSADHFIDPVADWLATVKKVLPHAGERIWCLGIEPSRPDTGYGYIEAGSEINDGLYDIRAFREKPDSRTAEEYFNSGRHYWNSGMFIFTPRIFLKETESTAPEIADLARRGVDAGEKRDQAFRQMPDISVDYAVLEKASSLGVAPCRFQWDDVGSFEAVSRIQKKDTDGNYTERAGTVESLNSGGNIVLTDRKTALLGVENLVIVEHEGVLLVAARDAISDIKKIRAKFNSSDL